MHVIQISLEKNKTLCVLLALFKPLHGVRNCTKSPVLSWARVTVYGASHVLPVSAWSSSKFFGFLLPPKDLDRRWWMSVWMVYKALKKIRSRNNNRSRLSHHSNGEQLAIQQSVTIVLSSILEIMQIIFLSDSHRAFLSLLPFSVFLLTRVILHSFVQIVFTYGNSRRPSGTRLQALRWFSHHASFEKNVLHYTSSINVPHILCCITRSLLIVIPAIAAWAF